VQEFSSVASRRRDHVRWSPLAPASALEAAPDRRRVRGDVEGVGEVFSRACSAIEPANSTVKTPVKLNAI
jgi:hypothetical protein